MRCAAGMPKPPICPGRRTSRRRLIAIRTVVLFSRVASPIARRPLFRADDRLPVRLRRSTENPRRTGDSCCNSCRRDVRLDRAHRPDTIRAASHEARSQSPSMLARGLSRFLGSLVERYFYASCCSVWWSRSSAVCLWPARQPRCRHFQVEPPPAHRASRPLTRHAVRIKSEASPPTTSSARRPHCSAIQTLQGPPRPRAR